MRPSNEFVRSIETRVPDEAAAAGALYALASVDARTLRHTPHNIGILYLHPEVQDERFDAFRRERAELRATYGRLGAAAADPEAMAGLDESRLGMLLIQLVEVVIRLRRDGEASDDDDATIAASCLRLVGLTTVQIEAARTDAVDLIRLAEDSETTLAAS